MARVSYTVGGVQFSREIFSSPVDQVIAIRLTANKPGQINFTTGMRTPQNASVRAEGKDTLVLRGVNASRAALPARSSSRSGARRRKAVTIEAANAAIKVSGADEAVLLIAAATSYRRYDDVSGDPEALTKQTLDAASRKKFNTLRQAHVAEHQRLFRRVKLDLGTTEAARLPTDERIKFRRRRRLAARRPLFSIRSLSADLKLASRYAACQSAGHLE